MNNRLRHSAALVALCAMLLRGVIPLGWMPGTQGTLMKLCTAYGLVEVRLDAAPSGAAPAHDSAYQLCSFALLTPVGSVHTPVEIPRAVLAGAIQLSAPDGIVPQPRLDAANPARAPPALLIRV